MNPHQEQIDSLLEHYLGLLNTYTRLRASLGSAHADMYQAIARANFSADRGARHGQMSYDQRMQAIQRVVIKSRTQSDVASPEGRDGVRGEATGLAVVLPWTCEVVGHVRQLEEAATADGNGQTKDEGGRRRSRDPLRWFGLMASPSLRDAQTKAVQSVTSIIPGLVVVDAEMRRIEVEIHQARKRRDKAHVAASAEPIENDNGDATMTTT